MSIIKNIKIIFFLISCMNFSIKASTIVFLHGTASSGKTSIANCFSKLPGWSVVDEDKICFEFSKQYWRRLFPSSMLHIDAVIAPENVFHAVKFGKIFFKDFVDESDKDLARKSISHIQETLNGASANDRTQFHRTLEENFTQTIYQALAAGNNICIVSAYYKPDLTAVNVDHRVIDIFAYCPYQELVRRIAERNDRAIETKNIWEYRFYWFAYVGFLSFCDLKTESKGSIDILFKDDVTQVLDFIEAQYLKPSQFASLERGNFTGAEYTLQQLNDYRNQMNERFIHNPLYVVPKKNYDLIVYTGSCASTECMQQILTYLNS